MGNEILLLGGVAAALLLVVALLLRRRTVGRPRPRSVPAGVEVAISRRVDERLGLAVAGVRAVRRGEQAPAELVPFLSATIDALAEDATLVREAPLPAGREAARDAIVAGIVRASRLTERVLDACLALEGTTRPENRERAERSLKWAEANLIEARAALAAPGALPALAGPSEDGSEDGATSGDGGDGRPVSSVG